MTPPERGFILPAQALSLLLSKRLLERIEENVIRYPLSDRGSKPYSDDYYLRMMSAYLSFASATKDAAAAMTVVLQSGGTLKLFVFDDPESPLTFEPWGRVCFDEEMTGMKPLAELTVSR